MDDALRCCLVVGLLRLIPDLPGPLLVAGVERPLEVLGEVPETGLDGAVLLEPPATLLVALGWCGHALAPLTLLLTDRENVTHAEQTGNRVKLCR